MEYYLVATEELTGVIETIHGFTPDSTKAQERVSLFDEEHAACDNYSLSEHECYEHNHRIVIHTIYRLEAE